MRHGRQRPTSTLITIAICCFFTGCSTLGPSDPGYPGMQLVKTLRDNHAHMGDQVLAWLTSTLDNDPWIVRYHVRFAKWRYNPLVLRELVEEIEVHCHSHQGRLRTAESSESNGGAGDLASILAICSRKGDALYGVNIEVSSGTTAIWISLDSFDVTSAAPAGVFVSVLDSMKR